MNVKYAQYIKSQYFDYTGTCVGFLGECLVQTYQTSTNQNMSVFIRQDFLLRQIIM